MISELERRGYARTGVWTPEVCVLQPQAVAELHREFARAGSDVLQAANFYANDSKLREMGIPHSVEEINRAACRLARQVASEEGGQLVSASLTATPLFGKAPQDQVLAAYREQLKPILEEGVDFIICEWMFDIGEMELAIAAARETSLPVVACMSAGTRGDVRQVSLEECAQRMARAGAHVVGTNCIVGPRNALQSIRRMRQSLEKAGLPRPLVLQPIGLKTPDDGAPMTSCPEWPSACEPITLTRFDARAFAREAYEEGVRYIGGCCYIRAHHIRAMAEELAPERGGVLPQASAGGGWGVDLAQFEVPEVAERCNKQYWMNMRPSLNGVEKSAAEYLADWRRD